MDIAALTRDRDQLFAEALYHYRAGQRWWPDAAFERDFIAPEQEARYEADAWEDTIDSFLAGRSRVTIGEVARDALGLDIKQTTVADQRRIRAALIRLKWVEGKRTGRGRWWISAKLVTQ